MFFPALESCSYVYFTTHMYVTYICTFHLSIVFFFSLWTIYSTFKLFYIYMRPMPAHVIFPSFFVFYVVSMCHFLVAINFVNTWRWSQIEFNMAPMRCILHEFIDSVLFLYANRESVPRNAKGCRNQSEMFMLKAFLTHPLSWALPSQ